MGSCHNNSCSQSWCDSLSTSDSLYLVLLQSQAEAHYKGNRHARRVKGIETSKTVRLKDGDKQHPPPTASPTPPGPSPSSPEPDPNKQGEHLLLNTHTQINIQKSVHSGTNAQHSFFCHVTGVLVFSMTCSANIILLKQKQDEAFILRTYLQ